MAAARAGAVIGLLGLVLAVVVAGCGGGDGQAPEAVAELMDCGPELGALGYAEGLGIGQNGELLIADTWNDRIVRAGPDCNVVGAFGEYGSGEGQLQSPRSVTTDKDGNIYVVDCWNHRVVKLSPQGRFLLALGGQGAPFGNDEAHGKFAYPYGVAVDSEGFIYVSDFNNNRIQKFDPQGKIAKDEDGEDMVWGTEGRQDGQFTHPAGLAMDSQDRLYVADVGNNRVQRFHTNGDFAGKWGKEGDKPGEFNGPYGVCVDAEDNVYVADFWNHRVQKFTSGGDLVWVYGERGGEKGQLELPLSVAAGADGAVYVSDWGNNRIQKLLPAS